MLNYCNNKECLRYIEVENLKTENALIKEELQTLKFLVVELTNQNRELKCQIRELKMKLEGRDSSNDKDDKGDGFSSDYLEKLKSKTIAKVREKNNRGAKEGHKGHGRKKCQRIDREMDLTLNSCPICNGKLHEHKKPEEHVKEDLVIINVATKYRVHRYECENCKEEVKPYYEQGFFGDNVKTYASLLHYYLGMPLKKISEFFSWFGLDVSSGSMVSWAVKSSEKFRDFYDKLKESLKNSPHINIDETGWPVDGDNRWLWVFVSPLGSYITINKSRGSKVIKDTLGDSFNGVIISDFYGAYNKIDSKKQKCLVHLLRDLKKWDKSENQEKRAFHYEFHRIFQDSRKLIFQKDGLLSDVYEKRLLDFYKDFDYFLDTKYSDKDCKRILKRLIKYRDELWTFLEENVPFHNNDAEREIRRSVINRKVSCGNRSDKGTNIQEILLSVINTVKMKGQNLLDIFQNPNKLSPNLS